MVSPSRSCDRWPQNIADVNSYLAFHLVADSTPIALVAVVVVVEVVEVVVAVGCRSYQACPSEIAALLLY